MVVELPHWAAASRSLQRDVYGSPECHSAAGRADGAACVGGCEAVVSTASVSPKALGSAAAAAVLAGTELTDDGDRASRGPRGDEVEARIAHVRPVRRERLLAAASG